MLKQEQLIDTHGGMYNTMENLQLVSIEMSPCPIYYDESDSWSYAGFQVVDACYHTSLSGYRYKRVWR